MGKKSVYTDKISLSGRSAIIMDCNWTSGTIALHKDLSLLIGHLSVEVAGHFNPG